MLTSKAKFSANAATTFGLATTVAALWMAAVPFAGAAAAGPPGYRLGEDTARPPYQATIARAGVQACRYVSALPHSHCALSSRP
jgi:hypothetical protein